MVTTIEILCFGKQINQDSHTLLGILMDNVWHRQEESTWHPLLCFLNGFLDAFIINRCFIAPKLNIYQYTQLFEILLFLPNYITFDISPTIPNKWYD